MVRLEQGLDLAQFSGIFEFAKVFGLLGQLLALYECVALVGDKV